VTGKDMKTNTVFVTTKLDDKKLWTGQIDLIDAHWINEPPKQDDNLKVRLRHRGPLIKIKEIIFQKNHVSLTLANEERAVTSGQSAVIYSGQEVLGGGIVA